MANVFKTNVHYVDTDAAIYTGRATIKGIQVVGGSAVTRVKIYDGVDATTPFKFDSGELAINTGGYFGPFHAGDGSGGIEFETGVYVDITTTGGYAFIYLA